MTLLHEKDLNESLEKSHRRLVEVEDMSAEIVTSLRQQREVIHHAKGNVTCSLTLLDHF